MSDERSGQDESDLYAPARAVLSDNHNYERGVAGPQEVIAGVLADAEAGVDGLSEVAD